MQGSLIPDADTTTLVAEIRAIVFHNAENGWCVARAKAESEPGTFSIVGTLGDMKPGEALELTGRWKEHPRFGRQFEVKTFAMKYPATEHGVMRYLGSGNIKGVGPTMAKRMVDAFGADVMRILDEEPDKLLEVDGVGKKTLERIKSSWNEQHEVRGLLLFLQTYDIPTTYGGRIFKHYGQGAIEKIKENPYDLAYVIRGIGFKYADGMARKLGFADDAPERLQAALVFALFTMSEQGSLFCPKEELFGKVQEMLGDPGGNGLMDEEKLDAALDSLMERKRVHVEDLLAQNIYQAVYLHHFYRYENEIASRLRDLLAHPMATTTRRKVEKKLPELEAQSNIALAAEQREAVLGACEHKAFIITGGPGTGKTTITRMIVRALADIGLSMKLAAPTGRAAKRMSEAAGMEASTIHRMLQYTPAGGFTHDETNKLKCDAVIVDEASMIDVPLFVSLLRALPFTCRLILVGDVNQLPPVGPGNPFADTLASETVPSVRLKHIYRQARESSIVRNAHRMNSGEFPVEDEDKEPPEKDFWWIRQEDPERVRDLIVQMVCERIPEKYDLDPRHDVQVLCPMHKGEAGTQRLNQVLQEKLNPLGPGEEEIARGHLKLRAGDRVLQLRNNYEKEVYNGDLGWISDIKREDREVLVEFDGRQVAYDSTELDELTLAYAVSVHKSQGSEYPAVVMPVLTQHFMLLQRNLLYTGLTRAQKLAVIIGGFKAMGIGLKSTRADKRYSHLRYRLMGAFNEV